MQKRIVVALGGNAIKQASDRGTVEEQLSNIDETCRQLCEIIEGGYEPVVTHGNGPQIGHLMIQNECAENTVPTQPLDVLGAMTQGQIGYMFQQSLGNHLAMRNLRKTVISVVTRVLVDGDDPNFHDPKKPVGPFYTSDEIRKLGTTRTYNFTKVKPKGRKVYRRVVPSPRPLRIIEGDAITKLVDAGIVVIASGGGGIPVTIDKKAMSGVEAVIDKDFAAGLLAELVHADILLMLTDVPNVFLNWGKPNQTPIESITIEEAKKHIAKKHFLEGSMKPKILAAIRFIEQGGEKAIIGHINETLSALDGKAGTLIT